MLTTRVCKNITCNLAESTKLTACSLYLEKAFTLQKLINLLLSQQLSHPIILYVMCIMWLTIPFVYEVAIFTQCKHDCYIF